MIVIAYVKKLHTGAGFLKYALFDPIHTDS